MLCQFCKKRMQKGKLYNGRRDLGLVWYPDGVKPPLLCSQKIVEAKGGVVLNKNSFSAY